MLTNYLKIAFRHFLKPRSYSLINILGLTIGMAGCLLILLYVPDELSYDRFHKNADRIYRATLETSKGKLVVTPSIVGPLFHREFPEVERFVRFYETTTYGAVVVQHGERIFQEERFMFADSTVFAVFTFPFLSGNSKAALTRPNTIVLTQAMTKKYFGDENPLGQTIRVNNARHYEITGVIKDVPRLAHLQFDFLASYTSLTNEWAANETWGSVNLYTYLLLHAPANVSAPESRTAALLKREAVDYWKDIHLQKLTAIHLYWDGDIARVCIFSTIAFFLLLIACINYMNLATARSARRAREVGVRKVLGAQRRQLALQFYGEIGVMTFLALIAGAGFPATWTKEQGYVYLINERALQVLGWQPDEAVGKWINLRDNRLGRVAGVVKDFHFASLHEEIEPLAMFIEPQEFRHILVKIGAQGLPGTLDFMRAKWREFAPNSPFEFSFLDREYEALYRSEQRAGKLLSVFAGLAIFIAALGLSGLASFTVEQRTKEIGVRKVLGASISGIIGLLSKDFVKLVLIAFAIALPIAWFAMSQWLQNFAYRIDMSLWVFTLAGSLGLIIALLTVSIQAVKAALANPVEALRYE